MGDDILLVDDDANTLRALERVLQAEKYSTRTAENAKAALESVKNQCPAIVLLDLGLPDAKGTDLLRVLLQEGVQHVIVISGTDSAEITRQCLREGAFDFLLKPASLEELLQAIRRATSSYQINQIATHDYPVELRPGFGALQTPSQESRRMFDQLEQISARDNANALVTGAPGLFKRDVAVLLHHYLQKTGPALLVNCALETDERAAARLLGYLERANNGTLILDDLSLLPTPVQEVLVKHITSSTSATGKDQGVSGFHRCNITGILKESVDDALGAGHLHPSLHDLLGPPNHVQVPSLADRPEDIAHFARHAVSQLNSLFRTEKSLSSEFIDFLTAQTWEGNLIALKNKLLIAYRGTENGEEIVFDPLFWPMASQDNAALPTYSSTISPLVGMTLADAELGLIKATLASVGDNKSKASKILGISVKTLYNRLKV